MNKNEVSELKIDELNTIQWLNNRIPIHEEKKYNYIEKLRIDEMAGLLKISDEYEKNKKRQEIITRPLTEQDKKDITKFINEEFQINKQYVYKVIEDGIKYCANQLCGYFTEGTYTHTLYKYINQKPNIIATKEYGLPCKFNDVDIPLRYADLIIFKDDICVIIELKKTKDCRITDDHINQLKFYKTLYNKQVEINNPYWPKTIYTFGIVVNFESIGNYPVVPVFCGTELICNNPCNYSIKYV